MEQKTAATFFVYKILSKYCKAHSKNKQSKECYFRTGHLIYYKVISLLLFHFEKGKKKKKNEKTDISMTSGALETQTLQLQKGIAAFEL